jgi:hypothetical protein
MSLERLDTPPFGQTIASPFNVSDYVLLSLSLSAGVQWLGWRVRTA